MGNKYIEDFCNGCEQNTIHRVFRRYGKRGRDGKKALRRVVTWCLACQSRKIDNTKKRKRM